MIGVRSRSGTGYRIRPRFVHRDIWLPACSTGEEAYSIAIQIREHLDRQKQGPPVQIFATDIDLDAIERARTGIYPESIVADVSTERLGRFFIKGDNSYRVGKDIRDMVVFAKQDVLKDPPFSRLDLISCRNLLIYLDGEAQKMVLPMFHYALNERGHLLLGNSETVGDFMKMFAAVDRKWKIYRREGAVSLHRRGDPYLPPSQAVGFPGLSRPPRDPARPVAVRNLLEQALLEGYIRSSVLIDPEFQVLYIHGRTGKFLEPAPGDASFNLLSMAREGIRMGLAAAVHKAVSLQAPVRIEGLQVKSNGDTSVVNLIVQPVTKPETARGLLLVIFEDAADGRWSGNCVPRKSICRLPSRSSRPPTRNSNPPMKKRNRRTKSCNPRTRNFRLPGKSCSRSTKS